MMQEWGVRVLWWPGKSLYQGKLLGIWGENVSLLNPLEQDFDHCVSARHLVKAESKRNLEFKTRQASLIKATLFPYLLINLMLALHCAYVSPH